MEGFAFSPPYCSNEHSPWETGQMLVQLQVAAPSIYQQPTANSHFNTQNTFYHPLGVNESYTQQNVIHDNQWQRVNEFRSPPQNGQIHKHFSQSVNHQVSNQQFRHDGMNPAYINENCNRQELTSVSRANQTYGPNISKVMNSFDERDNQFIVGCTSYLAYPNCTYPTTTHSGPQVTSQIRVSSFEEMQMVPRWVKLPEPIPELPDAPSQAKVNMPLTKSDAQATDIVSPRKGPEGENVEAGLSVSGIGGCRGHRHILRTNQTCDTSRDRLQDSQLNPIFVTSTNSENSIKVDPGNTGEPMEPCATPSSARRVELEALFNSQYLNNQNSDRNASSKTFWNRCVPQQREVSNLPYIVCDKEAMLHSFSTENTNEALPVIMNVFSMADVCLTGQESTTTLVNQEDIFTECNSHGKSLFTGREKPGPSKKKGRKRKNRKKQKSPFKKNVADAKSIDDAIERVLAHGRTQVVPDHLSSRSIIEKEGNCNYVCSLIGTTLKLSRVFPSAERSESRATRKNPPSPPSTCEEQAKDGSTILHTESDYSPAANDVAHSTETTPKICPQALPFPKGKSEELEAVENLKIESNNTSQFEPLNQPVLPGKLPTQNNLTDVLTNEEPHSSPKDYTPILSNLLFLKEWSALQNTAGPVSNDLDHSMGKSAMKSIPSQNCTLPTQTLASTSSTEAIQIEIPLLNITASLLESKMSVLNPCASSVETGLSVLNPCASSAETDMSVLDTCASTVETDMSVLNPCASSVETDMSLLDPCASSEEIDISVLDPCASSVETDLSVLDPCTSSVETDVSVLNPCASSVETDMSVLNPCASSEEIDMSVLDPCTSSVETDVSVLNPCASSVETDMSVLNPCASSEEIDMSVLDPCASSVETDISVLNPCASSVETDMSVLNPCTSSVETDMSVLNPFTSLVETDISVLNPCASSVETDMSMLNPCTSSVEIDMSVLNSCASSVETDMSMLNPCTSSVETDMPVLDPCASSVETDMSVLNPCTSSVETDMSVLDPCASSVETDVSVLNPSTSSGEKMPLLNPCSRSVHKEVSVNPVMESNMETIEMIENHTRPVSIIEYGNKPVLGPRACRDICVKLDKSVVAEIIDTQIHGQIQQKIPNSAKMMKEDLMNRCKSANLTTASNFKVYECEDEIVKNSRTCDFLKDYSADEKRTGDIFEEQGESFKISNEDGILNGKCKEQSSEGLANDIKQCDQEIINPDLLVKHGEETKSDNEQRTIPDNLTKVAEGKQITDNLPHKVPCQNTSHATSSLKQPRKGIFDCLSSPEENCEIQHKSSRTNQDFTSITTPLPVVSNLIADTCNFRSSKHWEGDGKTNHSSYKHDEGLVAEFGSKRAVKRKQSPVYHENGPTSKFKLLKKLLLGDPTSINCEKTSVTPPQDITPKVYSNTERDQITSLPEKQFHGRALSVVKFRTGKFFFLSELLKKTFAKLDRCFVQKTLERDLKISPVQVHRSIIRSTQKCKGCPYFTSCHSQLLSVNDAERLYVYFYGVQKWKTGNKFGRSHCIVSRKIGVKTVDDKIWRYIVIGQKCFIPLKDVKCVYKKCLNLVTTLKGCLTGKEVRIFNSLTGLNSLWSDLQVGDSLLLLSDTLWLFCLNSDYFVQTRGYWAPSLCRLSKSDIATLTKITADKGRTQFPPHDSTPQPLRVVKGGVIDIFGPTLRYLAQGGVKEFVLIDLYALLDKAFVMRELLCCRANTRHCTPREKVFLRKLNNDYSGSTGKVREDGVLLTLVIIPCVKEFMRKLKNKMNRNTIFCWL